MKDNSKKMIGQLLLNFGRIRKLSIEAFEKRIGKNTWFQQIQYHKGDPEIIAKKLEELIQHDEYYLKLIVKNLKSLKNIANQIRQYS